MDRMAFSRKAIKGTVARHLSQRSFVSAAVLHNTHTIISHPFSAPAVAICGGQQ